MTPRHARSLLAGLPLLAVLTSVVLAGTVAGPAVAAAPTAVRGTFTDEYRAGLEDVHVTAIRGSSTVDLGVTDANGALATSAGTGTARLTAGTWTFIATDEAEQRTAMGSEYAPLTFDRRIEAGTTTTLPTRALVPGGHLAGLVLAPSGTPLTGIDVSATSSWGVIDVPHGRDTTAAEGAFRLDGVGEAPVRVVAARTRTSDDPQYDDTGLTAQVDSASTTGGLVVEDWQVRCSTAFSLESSRRGQVTVDVASRADWAGLPKPGGTVVVKRGSTVVATVPWTGRSTWSTTLAGQPAGQRASYTATYTGGDCLRWSATRAVDVDS